MAGFRLAPLRPRTHSNSSKLANWARAFGGRWQPRVPWVSWGDRPWGACADEGDSGHSCTFRALGTLPHSTEDIAGASGLRIWARNTIIFSSAHSWLSESSCQAPRPPFSQDDGEDGVYFRQETVPTGLVAQPSAPVPPQHLHCSALSDHSPGQSKSGCPAQPCLTQEGP